MGSHGKIRASFCVQDGLSVVRCGVLYNAVGVAG
ncbi:hypothetical protein Mesil_1342 [Allomeiothermus silvanus DSM 9946]|uniref:Uncharacterized protein n=1 Tax=Allomeiothermus silvanus (strain ATCC 700542 / DSM 9946 / NBRC 106475 / NCIMB 13440 / VI-R2) TaxID=526227 RepID=D7BEJ2_ALLS1|nr:hypothetical protein Mesil_1342 [Allomeiothermus silvanus DSM 9946]